MLHSTNLFIYLCIGYYYAMVVLIKYLFLNLAICAGIIFLSQEKNTTSQDIQSSIATGIELEIISTNKPLESTIDEEAILEMQNKEYATSESKMQLMDGSTIAGW